MDKKVAHEIRNYIHQIISNAELIKSDDKSNKSIEKIKNAAYSIDAIMTDSTVRKPIININKRNIDLEKLKDLNILVVDDLIENIEIMQNIFKTLSCNIVSVMNGEDAIKIFKDGYKPDIVCMDMIMPGISGSVATQTLKSLGCNAYFIAISALKNQPHEVTSLFECWLPKPFTLEHIVSALSGYESKETDEILEKEFSLETNIPDEIKKDILSMAQNGLYSSLKELISTLENSASKLYLEQAIKKLDFNSIIKSIEGTH